MQRNHESRSLSSASRSLSSASASVSTQEAAPPATFEDYIKQSILISFTCSQCISVFDQICLVWVSVVLLGGFATALDARNFWFLAMLLWIQGVRYLMNMGIIGIATRMKQEPAHADRAPEHVRDPAAPNIRPLPPSGDMQSDGSANMFTRVPLTQAPIVLRNLSTLCYAARFVSFVCRLVISIMALCWVAVDTGIQNEKGYPGQLRPALFIYYAMMMLSSFLYFGAIEVWGWHRMICDMRVQAQNHNIPFNVQQHQQALRYAYYLYFKAHSQSVAAMMISNRMWQQGPTADEIVLPWPWVEAADWRLSM